MVVQWLALLPHSKKLPGFIPFHSFYREFACFHRKLPGDVSMCGNDCLSFMLYAAVSPLTAGTGSSTTASCSKLHERTNYWKNKCFREFFIFWEAPVLPVYILSCMLNWCSLLRLVNCSVMICNIQCNVMLCYLYQCPFWINPTVRQKRADFILSYLVLVNLLLPVHACGIHDGNTIWGEFRCCRTHWRKALPQWVCGIRETVQTEGEQDQWTGWNYWRAATVDFCESPCVTVVGFWLKKEGDICHDMFFSAAGPLRDNQHVCALWIR